MVQRATTDYVRTTIDRTQGRSMVMSAGGIAASEHPLASQAGASMLARGGHAVDAAIAANAVMGVVAPMMNGVGGDLFAIVYDAAADELHGLNASGWAPAALTHRQLLRRSGITAMPQTGIHSVTVPGAVAGWAMLHAAVRPHAARRRPGAGDWRRRRGLSGPRDHRGRVAGQRVRVLQATDESARVYLPGGRAPRVGADVPEPRSGDELPQIAADGRDAFYRGEIAATHPRLLGTARRRA